MCRQCVVEFLAAAPISDPSEWETEADSYLPAYSHWHTELCLFSFLISSLHVARLFSLGFLYSACVWSLIMFLSSWCFSFRLSHFSITPLLFTFDLFFPPSCPSGDLIQLQHGVKRVNSKHACVCRSRTSSGNKSAPDSIKKITRFVELLT